MCFDVINPKRKKARYDIICFKLVDDDSTIPVAKSPIQGFKWTAGEEYECELDMSTYNEIHQGFHACKTIRGCRNLQRQWGDGDDLSYNIGIFVIPKGAEYYENDTQYVSNRMKMLIGDYRYAKQIIKALTTK